MAAGTHWLAGADPYDIAWKLVASNLSDLAAKGAEPIGVLLSYTLSDNDQRFLDGLSAILKEYGVPLLGGDTIGLPNSTPAPQVVGLTAIGRATHTPVPSRAGAQIGDDVFVCGVIGDAMAGYQELTKGDQAAELGLDSDSADPPDPWFAERFLRPRPLLSDGQKLAPYVSAMMDVSDGLFLDASRLAQSSRVTLSLETDAVPHSARFLDYAAQGNQLDVSSKGWPTREAACRWGDDYALLFTASAVADLPDHVTKTGVTRIGKVVAQSPDLVLIDGNPAPDQDRLGYIHRSD